MSVPRCFQCNDIVPDEGALCQRCQKIRSLRQQLAEARAELKKRDTCQTCDGDGVMDVVVRVLPPDDREEFETVECAECRGTGIGWYGQILVELSQAQTALVEATEKACRAVMPALKGYRCQHTTDPDGEGLALVDKLCTPNRCDISTGTEEMRLLEDAICGAIMMEAFHSPPAQATQRLLEEREKMRAVVEAARREGKTHVYDDGSHCNCGICLALDALETRRKDKS